MNNLKLITSGQKFGFCMVSFSPIRNESSDKSEMTSQLLFGEPVQVIQVLENWVEIETYFDGYRGYVDRKHILAISEKELRNWINRFKYAYISSGYLKTPWGIQPIMPASFIDNQHFNIGPYNFTQIENVNVSNEFSAFELGLTYLNTPYLWGGKTTCGIDCSGLVQSVFRMRNVNLPRDAYQQADSGIPIEFEELTKDDVAFFSNKEGKIIHVGIVNHDYSIVHASGRVRIDNLTKEGIWNNDYNKLTHSLNCIKRYH